MMGFYLPEFVPLMDTFVCRGGFSEGIFAYGGSAWIGTSLVALAATAAIISFLYLLASIFQNQQALAALKMDVYEFAVTIAIFVVLFMMLEGMCSVKTGWVFPDAGQKTFGTGTFTSWADKSIYYSATNYLMDFADYSLWIMNMQYAVYMGVDWLTTMEITSVPMGLGATLKPTSGLGAVIKPVLNNAFSAETIGVITAEAQAYVMDFGTYGMLKYFLPLGLVLRSFIPTRRIGGTLIALTCVFLFIYPLLVIPTYMVVNDSLLGTIDYLKGADSAGVFGATSAFNIFLEFYLKYLWGPNFLLTYSLMMMPAIAKIFFGGVFMPLFNTIILVTFARYLSKTLGEEIDITNLTRMI